MFHSAHGVLRWAYLEIGKSVIKQSGIHRLRGSGGGSGNPLLAGLTPMERHKQAVNIIGMVMALPDRASQEMIGASYGGLVGKKDLRTVVSRVMPTLGTGMHSRSAISDCVRLYFTCAPSYRAMRRVLQCDDAHALQIRARLAGTLDVLHVRAMAEITESFERAQLIKAAACA